MGCDWYTVKSIYVENAVAFQVTDPDYNESYLANFEDTNKVIGFATFCNNDSDSYYYTDSIIIFYNDSYSENLVYIPGPYDIEFNDNRTKVTKLKTTGPDIGHGVKGLKCLGIGNFLITTSNYIENTTLFKKFLFDSDDDFDEKNYTEVEFE